MDFLKDDHAQTGTILFFLFGIFFVGIVYVIFGSIMANVQDANNDVIVADEIPYSQERYDAMENILLSFWAFPIYVIILFVIYAIKKGIDKRSQAAY